MLGGRIVDPGEPLWTQEDTDLAVALTEIEGERCPGCGHSRVESMNPDNEFDFVATPAKCHACATRDRAARRAGSSDSWDDAGINWMTTRRDDGG